MGPTSFKGARCSILALLLTGALFSPSVVEAAVPSRGELNAQAQKVTWVGTVPTAPQLAPCLNCDVFRVDVNLPSGFWANTPGSLQFGVRWPYDESGMTDVDLRVYGPNGLLLGMSRRPGVYTSVDDSDAESISVPSAGNGTYRVEVVPTLTPLLGSVSYEGLVEVELAPVVQPVRDLLPDMKMLPPENVKFGDFNEGSCLIEEQLEQGAQKCLRFNQTTPNTGRGAMEVRYDFASALETQRLVQRVYRSDGSFYDRAADRWEFHPTHAHFHYVNFAASKLWRSDAAGSRLGTTPIAEGRKVGFCLIDVFNEWYGLKGDQARTYQSCYPQPDLPNGVALINGISVGWSDDYDYDLPSQYIEVTGVPDGYYLLEAIVDPVNTLLEIDDTNNSGSTHIRICGDSVDIVGETTTCGS